jgi:hypothetical protein
MTVGSTQQSCQISLAPNLESSGSPLGIRLQFHDARIGNRWGGLPDRALGLCQPREIRAVSGRDGSLDPGGQQLSDATSVLSVEGAPVSHFGGMGSMAARPPVSATTLRRMATPLKALTEMTGVERDDFLTELHAAVYEELSLWEVPGGSKDLLGKSEVVHGPWRPEDCATVLRLWWSAGLLALYRCNEDGSPGDFLPAKKASALLDRPNLWVRPDTWTAVVNLAVSEVGRATELNAWMEIGANP